MVVSKFYINTRIFIKTWFNRIDKISAVSVTLLANGLFHGAHWSLGRPTIFQLGIYGCYLHCFNIIQSNDKSRADYKQILKMFLLNSLLVQFLAKRFWMRVNRMIMILIFSRERERGPIIFYKWPLNSDEKCTYVHAVKTMKFGDIKVHFLCIFHDN